MIYVLILGGYLLLLIVLIIFYIVFDKSLIYLYANLVYNIEKINYEYLLLVVKHKQDIYRYKDSLDVLFASKNNFIKGFKYDLDYFISYLKGLRHDIEYFQELINSQIYDFNKIGIVEDLILTMRKAANPRKFIKTLLYIITLGIFGVYVGFKKSY